MPITVDDIRNAGQYGYEPQTVRSTVGTVQNEDAIVRQKSVFELPNMASTNTKASTNEGIDWGTINGVLDQLDESTISHTGGETLADKITKSDTAIGRAYRAVMYNKDDYAKMAREAGEALGISPDILVHSNSDTIERAAHLARQREKYQSTQDFIQSHPELANIQFKTETEAIEAIHNAKNINQTRGIIDAIQQGFWSMNDQINLGYAGAKLSQTTDPVERERLLKEVRRLQKNLSEYRHADDTLESIFEQTTGMAWLMGRQGVEGAADEGVKGAAVGATLGASTGSAAMGVGAIPGAIAGTISGLSLGTQVGMAHQMFNMSQGLKYIELMDRVDADGNPIYSHEEATKRSVGYAAIDTAIEFASFKGMAKAVGMAGKATTANLAKGLGEAGTFSTFSKGIGTTVAQAVKSGAKSGAYELVEEGAQDVNEKVQANLFNRDEHYTWQDIATGASGAMTDALPGVFGLSIIGGGFGGAHSLKRYREFKALSPEQQQLLVQAEINSRSNAVVTSLVEDAKSNELATNNPELYAKVVQAQGDHNGLSTVYINPTEAVETEEGQVALQQLVDAGLVTQEDVQEAIETDSALQIPIGMFTQMATTFDAESLKALQNVSYYTEGGQSFSSIQKANNIRKEQEKQVTQALQEKRNSVKEELMKHMGEMSEEEAAIAEMIMDVNPYDPMQAYQYVRDNLYEDFLTQYETDLLPELQVNPNVLEQVKSIHGLEKYMVALDILKELAIQDYSGTLSETALAEFLGRYDSYKETIQHLIDVDKVGEKLQQLEHSEAVYTIGLSDSGKSVYHTVLNALQSGNESVVEQSKAAAALFASHAEASAKILQEAGREGYTAEDFVREYAAIETSSAPYVEGFYQAKSPKNLIAYHNISAENLEKSLALGGLPVPSIAVTHKDVDYTDFGEISLIMKPDVVNPKETPVFSRDAWTTTFPTIYRKGDKKKLVNYSKNVVQKFQADNPKLQFLKFGNLYTPSIADNADVTTNELEQILEGFLASEGAKYLFLNDIGDVPVLKNKVLKMEAPYPFNDNVEALHKRLAALDKKYKAQGGLAKLTPNPEENSEWAKDYAELKAFIAKHVEDTPSDSGTMAERTLSSLDRGVYFHRIQQAYVNSGKKVPNEEAFLKSLDAKIKKHEEAFQEWQESLRNDMLSEPRLQETDSPITLDNIVEAMVGNIANEQKTMFGVGHGNVIASTGHQFDTVDEMRAQADSHIKPILSEEEREAIKAQYQEIHDRISNFVHETSRNFMSDEPFQLLVEFAGGRKTFKQLAKQYGVPYSKELEEQAKGILADIKALPVEYFEAKPQRAVSFEEVAAAVVPKTLSKKIRDRLTEHGISVSVYNPMQEGDRQHVVKQVQEKNYVLFQAPNGKQIQGLTHIMDNDKKVMQLFDTADHSTFVHECGHIFLEDLRMMAALENAPEQVTKDWETVKAAIGYKEGASADENRKAHETFAKWFEAYLREGNAPTEGLTRVFRNFRNWLTKVYATLLHLGGKPSAEVEGVMSRMLATEEAVDTWSRYNNLDGFTTVGTFAQLSTEEQSDIHEAINVIKEGAKERVLKEYMKDLDGHKEKLWEEKKAEIQEQIERQLSQRNEAYAVRMAYNELGPVALVGTPFTTLSQLEVAERKAGGMYEDVLKREMEEAKATIMSSDLDKAMLNKMANDFLLTTQGEARLAEEEAKAVQKIGAKLIAKKYEALSAVRRVKTTDTLLADLGTIDDTEVRNAIAEIEKKPEQSKEILRILKEKLSKQIQHIRKIQNIRITEHQRLKANAEARLNHMALGQATSWKRHQNQAVMASKVADNALANGDVSKAMEYKQKQMLYIAMSRAAYENDKTVEKAIRDLKKKTNAISRPKKPIRVEPSARYFIQELMYKLQLTKQPGLEPQEGMNMQAIMALLDPDAALTGEASGFTIEPWVMDVFTNGKKWNQLTLEEFMSIAELIRGLYKSGKRAYEGTTILNKEGKHISFDDAAGEMITTGMINVPGKQGDALDIANAKDSLDNTSETIGRYFLSLTKVETILRRLDGGQVGVWTRYIYDPINRATVKAKTMLEEATRNLSNVIGIYSRKELSSIRHEKAYSVGSISNMTKEQVITLALNWGTEANRQRAIETVQANQADIESLFARVMTEKDWQFVEGVWSLINGYFEERSAVQERLYGSPMKKETGIAFKIGDRTIQGDYYPIVYDPQMDAGTLEYTTEDIIKSQLSSNAVWGMGMSATKSRMKTVKNKKLMLSFDVIPRAIDEAINHIAMREAATDVNKLINRRDVSEFIMRRLSPETLNVLKAWVRDNWQEEISKTTPWDRALMRFKANTTFAIMGFRTSTALLNVLNLFPMMKVIGKWNTFKAVKEFYGSPATYKNNRAFVMEHSIFLRERIHNLDRDLEQGLKIVNDGLGYKSEDTRKRKMSEAVRHAKETKEFVNKYAYLFITETDLMLSMPLWKHEYDKRAAELVNEGVTDVNFIESEAVGAGDRAVRRVFGSGDTKDTVEFQRRKSFINLFTPFYTYCSTVMNALIEAGYAVKDRRDYGELFNTMLFWILIQSIAEGCLRAMWDNDDDDLDSMSKKIQSSIIGQLVGGLPLIRDAVSLSMNAMFGERVTTKGDTALALNIIPKLYDTISGVKNGKQGFFDVMRTGTEVANRFWGLSDTMTDGFWTLMKWMFTNTDASVGQLLRDIAFDKRLKDK